MYYFITNLHGGSGRAFITWKKIKKTLEKENISYKLLLSEHEGHAGDLAASLDTVDDEDIRLVVVGGDGTINGVLNGIKDFSKIKFGVIPTGSGNDFCRGNKIKRYKHHPEKALKNILNSKCETKIDIGVVRGDDNPPRYFGISSGIGMDAIVCKKTLTSKLKFVLNCLHLGNLTYILLTIYTLFSMKCNDVEVRFDDEEPCKFNKLIFLAGMNTYAEGGGVKMAPDASPTDGNLSFCGVRGIPKFLTFFAFPFLILGKHKNLKGFYLRNFKKMEVKCDKPMVLHTDGEYAGDVTHVSMELMESVLTLMK